MSYFLSTLAAASRHATTLFTASWHRHPAAFSLILPDAFHFRCRWLFITIDVFLFDIINARQVRRRRDKSAVKALALFFRRSRHDTYGDACFDLPCPRAPSIRCLSAAQKQLTKQKSYAPVRAAARPASSRIICHHLSERHRPHRPNAHIARGKRRCCGAAPRLLLLRLLFSAPDTYQSRDAFSLRSRRTRAPPPI